ncbi:MAG TPA: AgmX/PglI C-terminal domain-containing protein [Kofleriaceae bacterium]|nr:AgmX/PglI C-terminal domain-containing protein [Kofleriaceae bacterium]
MSTSKLSLTFRIFKGEQLLREERLAQSIIKVGKVPSAQLQIDDESVSRMHAIVEVTGGEVSIVDLGSTRGTFVNGQKVTKAKLRTGDSIQLGDVRVEIAIGELAVVQAAAPVAPVARPPALPAAVRAAVVAPAAPVIPSPVARLAPVAPAPAAETGSAKAVEVAAMLGDSVVGVKHCMDPRSGKVTRATWGFAAGGLACLLASASAFYVSVHTASSNAEARQHHTQVLHKPAYSFRPQQVGGLVDGVAFGGLALGLAAATAALVRSRRERRSPFYRIGTAPGVEQPLEGAPSESYPLVAPSGDDFVFNYGPGIEGELITGGVTTPLAQLAATGQLQPSATTPGAVEIPIPADARIRARTGQATFLVSAVARPQQQLTTAFAAALEGRAMKYVAGSLAAHLGVVFLLNLVPIAEAGANVELQSREPQAMVGKITDKEDMPKKQEDGDNSTGTDGDSQEAAAMKLPSGTAGDPKQPKPDGKLQIDNRDVPPQVARQQAIEAARTAGILGSTMLRDNITAMTSDLDFSSGFDHINQLGALDGSAGAGRGTFGMGVSGDGPGGGCFMPPCGIIGSGGFNTGRIGTGKHAGEGYWTGKSGPDGLRDHVSTAPRYSYPTAISGTGLDKAIIKRYIKRSEASISYCYEKELLARPGLSGSVTIQFLISSAGDVQSSNGQGFDGVVASCVANVIKTINFPAPKDGSNVTVNYPFTFKTAG